MNSVGLWEEQCRTCVGGGGKDVGLGDVVGAERVAVGCQVHIEDAVGRNR